MAIIKLFLTHQRSATSISVNNFVKGGLGVSERALVNECNQWGVTIELYDGRTNKKITEGSYAQISQFLRKLNEGALRTFSNEGELFLEPQPPIGF